ncbi:MAG TPA: DUF1667 domain-containing protein [Bacilli bacterium]|jgi:CxxC motif-containing protein|nr:DUF1667 domain-containing protein [Bacilli bacterium]HOC80515.1 DUF1667 domain-containing protein [Bacilli bacterium]
MKKSLTCIVCPNGCRLEIETLSQRVSGNKCPRGITFAIDELTNPKRSITTTVHTTLLEYPVISVRTDGEIAKDKIRDLLALLKDIAITEYLPINTIIIHNVFGTNINVITTSNMQKGENCV